MQVLRNIGIGVVFVWFMVGGIGHFTSAEFFLAIMPPWVPAPLAAVYVSGFFEIALAVGILLPQFRAWSGIGLVLLTLAVTPANVYMWQNPEKFPDISESLLLIRLFVQVLLLLLIWWATKNKNESSV